ncbi:ECF-type sigma factor [Stieleria sp. ICT_E10.1]|uniref:ECF-type sigma factor n=1 Tax=Stieleria sedimenti TaxID=2976331 RepID=UPI0021801C1F|nr:ECF-type sigma factor [Stieleria sedimenti]MCS7469968.1 ECF-type sigma factor [Stieleria sedimenti]
MSDVTQILSQIEQGDPSAADQLLPLVYEELRKLAAARLKHEKPGQTLQATALVHDAYIRLVGNGSPFDWNGRGHFFGAAAEAMRRILVENARRKQRIKHGGGRRPIPIDEIDVADESTCEDLLTLNIALEQLESEMPEVAQVVKLRYFSGLTVEQAGQSLGISTRTAHRHWAYAKARLFQLLNDV